jgi:nucleoside-diphosphate-sugar epimerase
MTRSVVTGAAGFVGSRLAERLLALGHDVVAVDCFTDYYDRRSKESNIAAARANESFQLLEEDLCVLDLERLLDGADYVFHLAGQAGVRPSWGASFAEYVRQNISVTQRLLEAAKDARLQKFVFASSSSVYGDAKELPVTEGALPRPVSPYGVTKLAAEHLCSLYGRLFALPIVSLRLFTVYGPRQRPDMAIQRFLTAAQRDEPVTVYGDGEQTRDFTFVGDVVDAHVLAMGAAASEGVFNVCGGTTITVAALLELIERVTGRKLRIEHAEAARGDARHTLGDNSAAKAALGFAPKVSLANGVAAQWEWLKETQS